MPAAVSDTVDAAALARVLNVASADVPALVRAGMPKDKRGYSPQRCILWYVRHLQGQQRPATSDVGLSREDIAAVLGITTREITNLVKGHPDFPSVTAGRERTFPLGACVRWYVQFKADEAAARAGGFGRGGRGVSDLDVARQRKTMAEARKAERELEILEENLISLDEHEQRVEALAARLAARCKGLDRFLADVQRATTAVEAKAALDAISDGLLATLRGVADDLSVDGEEIPGDDTDDAERSQRTA